MKRWRWLGRRSPLMMSKWVLERLMDTLEKDLQEQGEGNLERETRGNGRT
jgi:hypothetical protein